MATSSVAVLADQLMHHAMRCVCSGASKRAQDCCLSTRGGSDRGVHTTYLLPHLLTLLLYIVLGRPAALSIYLFSEPLLQIVDHQYPGAFEDNP